MLLSGSRNVVWTQAHTQSILNLNVGLPYILIL